MTDRYPELEAAWAELERAKIKVTGVHWTSDHDVLHAGAPVRVLRDLDQPMTKS